MPKLSSYPSATSLDDTVQIPIIQSGANKNATPSQVVVAALAAMSGSTDGVPAISHPFMAGLCLSGAEWDTNPAYPTNQVIDYFLGKFAATSTSVPLARLPFKWARMQPTLNGALDATQLADMDRVVTRWTAAGGRIALDMHNYMRRGQSGQGTDIIGKFGQAVTAAHFADCWARLATRYKGNARVIFDLMNEPHDMDNALVVSNQNLAIQAIRATTAHNLILVSGNNYSGAHQWGYGAAMPTAMLGIKDPENNLAWDIHQYLDPGYSGTSTTCEYNAGMSKLSAFTAWARTNKFRAVLGEFGFANNSGCVAEVTDLLEYVNDNRDVWIGWTFWSGGQATAGDVYTINPDDFNTPTDKPQLTTILPYKSGVRLTVPQPLGGTPPVKLTQYVFTGPGGATNQGIGGNVGSFTGPAGTLLTDGGGVAYDLGSLATSGLSLGTFGAITTGQTISGICVFSVPTLGVNQVLFSSGGVQGSFVIRINMSGYVEIDTQITQSVVVSTNMVAVNGINVVAWRVTAGTGGSASVAVNGILTTSNSTLTFVGGTARFGTNGDQEYVQHRQYLSAVDRTVVLTDSQLVALSNDPYSLFV